MLPNSELMHYWETVEQPIKGDQSTPNSSVGRIFYQAEPIQIQGRTEGVFIVAYTEAEEWEEVAEAMKIVISVMLIILLFASLLAWVISGRILRSLRLMSATARNISESDLSQRIHVTGSGEMAEVAKTFNEMMDRLQSAFVSQRNFINDAGHELRTPITIIQGHLELMGDDPDEQQEVLALVRDELKRIKRFVSDLLLLAKAEQPDFLRPEPVELDLLTEELFAKARVLTQCDCQLESVAIGYVYLDRQRLTQAVMNLVENAAQHTPDDGLIVLGSAIENQVIRFWVRDTGEGIATYEQTRIFERFARAKNNYRRSEGAGLGLAIVQAIVTACGGYIELESQLGQGSMFTLLLPLQSNSIDTFLNRPLPRSKHG
ncbi:MAG: HAMP domain-containing histidine kinase [Cyanobacteria bacterium CRU_2_1]|nr:HAMP domain-containing histidine kinase [Cyanobacteria bacterium CRU_2_1]